MRPANSKRVLSIVTPARNKLEKTVSGAPGEFRLFEVNVTVA